MQVLRLEAFIDFRNVYYSLATLGISVDYAKLPTLLATLVQRKLNRFDQASVIAAAQVLESQSTAVQELSATEGSDLVAAAGRFLDSVDRPRALGNIMEAGEPSRVVVSQVFGVVAVPCNVHDDDAFAAGGVERFAYSLERNRVFKIDRVKVDYKGYHFRQQARNDGPPSEVSFVPAEKGVDTVLALRMQERCLAANHPDVVVLLSGDADLAPALQVAASRPDIEAFVAGFTANAALSSVYRLNNALGYEWPHEPIILDDEIMSISKSESDSAPNDYEACATASDTIGTIEEDIKEWVERLSHDSLHGTPLAEAVVNSLAVRARLLRIAGLDSEGRSVSANDWHEKLHTPLVRLAKEFAGYVPALRREHEGDWDKELELWSAKLDALAKAEVPPKVPDGRER